MTCSWEQVNISSSHRCCQPGLSTREQGRQIIPVYSNKELGAEEGTASIHTWPYPNAPLGPADCSDTGDLFPRQPRKASQKHFDVLSITFGVNQQGPWVSWASVGTLTAPLMAAEGLQLPLPVSAAAPPDPFWSLSSCIVFAQNSEIASLLYRPFQTFI